MRIIIRLASWTSSAGIHLACLLWCGGEREGWASLGDMLIHLAWLLLWERGRISEGLSDVSLSPRV